MTSSVQNPESVRDSEPGEGLERRGSRGAGQWPQPEDKRLDA